MKNKLGQIASATGFTRREFLRAGAAAGASCAILGSAPIGAAAVPSGKKIASTTLDITEFDARSGDGSDTTPSVRRALQASTKAGAKTVVFPTGVYDFWPDRAVEKYVYASNNDPGLKRIAFPLFEMDDLEIDGQGSKFVFHSGINPFVIGYSRNIRLANFSIDWKRPFHNEGAILAVGKNGIDLQISEQFPYRVDKGLLYFLGENGEGCGIRDRDPCPVGGLLEFDTQRRETAYMVRDYYRTPFLSASVISPGKVRIVEPSFPANAGNTLVFGTTNRNYPAFTISDSRAVKLANVTIHHCGGMGVIAQRSGDLELDHVQVTPSAGRVVSLPADATHFVNCSGSIRMTNCLFENQLDDATNIHGVYAQITGKISPNEIEVRLVHPAQRGFDFIVPSQKLELVHSDSLVTYAQVLVKSVSRVNEQYTRVELAGRIPSEFRKGDVVASIEAYPDVVIRHCVIQNNRARGLLLGSRGKIVIEDNSFHTPGASILMEGDARYWFEQAGVRDLVIRRNQFNNCNFGVWGKSTIEVGAGIDPAQRPASRYNRNILIENNQFRVFDRGPLVSVYSVDGLTIQGNRVERTTAYPARPRDENPFDITNSVNVKIEENNDT
jgi:Right handed beta helix region